MQPFQPQGSPAQFALTPQANNPNYAAMAQQLMQQGVMPGMGQFNSGQVGQFGSPSNFGQTSIIGAPSMPNLQQGPIGQQLNSQVQQGFNGSSAGQNMNNMAQGAGAYIGNLCCFIMIQGHNGYLPWFIRPLRDVSYRRNPFVAKGYVCMAKWLCPLMRKYKFVNDLVKGLVVEPLTEHCGYIASVYGCKPRINYQRFWFSVWNFVGKYLTKNRI